jgi:hypothetical protein
MPIEIRVVDAHSPLSRVLFYTRTGLANQSGWRISLMTIIAFLSGEKRHNRCFTGLDPSLTLILCSANSFGTPGMSASFQAKISLLSWRKLVSASSYFADRWALMVAVLEGSPVPKSICLTSASFGGPRMVGLLAEISSSSGFISAATVAISSLPLAAYVLAAIWITWTSQSKARFRSPRRERTPLGPDILSKRYE